MNSYDPAMGSAAQDASLIHALITAPVDQRDRIRELLSNHSSPRADAIRAHIETQWKRRDKRARKRVKKVVDPTTLPPAIDPLEIARALVVRLTEVRDAAALIIADERDVMM
jgi:hypothetical protein